MPNYALTGQISNKQFLTLQGAQFHCVEQHCFHHTKPSFKFLSNSSIKDMEKLEITGAHMSTLQTLLACY